jgi:membrane protease subunit HflK
MAWNEPGGKRRDPWQGGGGGGSEPPDLDALLKRFRDGFGKTLGGGGRGSAGGFVLLIVGLLVAWFALDSWRRVDETERVVVLRFGEFNRIMPAGLNFKWPTPIETSQVVDITNKATSDRVRMLTRDENLIDIEFNVQYQVSDPRGYVFAARSPEETVRLAAESAVRSVIGINNLDVALSGERTRLSSEARDILQQTLDTYGVGIGITELSFQDVRPPQEVKEAFDDAISAREDKQRLENEAQAYASKVVPEARGQAARIRAEAEGAREAAIATASGAAERFSLLAAQYRAAPQVTRKRLMLETMQEVLAGTPKVVVEGGGDKVLYLPMDQLGRGGTAPVSAGTSGLGSASSVPPAVIEAARSGRDGARNGREGRD